MRSWSITVRSITVVVTVRTVVVVATIVVTIAIAVTTSATATFYGYRIIIAGWLIATEPFTPPCGEYGVYLRKYY